MGGLLPKEYNNFKGNLLSRVLIALWYQELELLMPWLGSSWCLGSCAVCFPALIKQAEVLVITIFGRPFELTVKNWKLTMK